MARQINQEVTVTLVADPEWAELRPESFRWRRQIFRVKAVLDSWREIGRWWEEETEATVWRVLLADGGLCELLMYHTQPPQWRLMVIYD